jgi:hypothetical protein
MQRLLKLDQSDNIAIQTALPLYRGELKSYFANLTMSSEPLSIPAVLENNAFVTS